MKPATLALAALALATPAAAQSAQPAPADLRAFCATSPFAKTELVREMIPRWRQRRPELASETDDRVVEITQARIIDQCVAGLRRDRSALSAILSFPTDNGRDDAWTSWSIVCDMRAPAGACIRREVAARQAIRAGQVAYPAAASVAGLCHRMLTPPASGVETKACVDVVAPLRPSEQLVARCALATYSTEFRPNTRGADAGRELVRCFRRI